MVFDLDRVIRGLLSHPQGLLQEMAIGIVIFIAAFLPRLISLGTMITSDEPTWFNRSHNFVNALTALDLAHTFQHVHPGVTLMWISGLASWLSETSAGLTGFAPLSFDQQLFFMLLPVAMATSLGVVAVFFLARELFGVKIAALAAAIIAFDPFLVGHSRVLQLDALLATFMLISALAMLVYLKKDDYRYLIFACVTAGLAVLTKSPGLFLIPFLFLSLAAWRYFDQVSRRRMTFRAYLRGLAKPALIILVTIATTFVVVWPAMWVEPVQTLDKYINGIEWAVETPHERGGFFMGDYLDGQYPLSYYPVVFLMRSTPFALIFLPIAAAFVIARAVSRRFSAREMSVALLLVYVVAFSVEMTLGDKKFDRYLLPVFPAADVLGAVGIGYCAEAIVARLWGRSGQVSGEKSRHRADATYAAALALVTIVSLAILVPLQPYFLSYYNPVIPGNPSNAPNVLLIGWGDGLDAAARYLNEKPGADKMKVAVNYNGFTAFFHGQTVTLPRKENNLTGLEGCDYVVFYVSAIQRTWNLGLMQQFHSVPPEKIIRLNGIDHCWIYKVEKSGEAAGS
ncbi:MAG: Dolichyl-phosphate-mannose-protein mannosyltransferase [Methanocella sp. PtaU1.Bin125]|nr:MAG: Dolichyl-phosphate-mannose-protein mannosyltransferase [Methanocella sp. PtaU1.Bin125]